MKVEVDLANSDDYNFLNEFDKLKRLKPDITWDDIIWAGLLKYMNEVGEEDDETNGGAY